MQGRTPRGSRIGRNDEGENEREERAKVGARVYKLVI